VELEGDGVKRRQGRGSVKNGLATQSRRMPHVLSRDTEWLSERIVGIKL